jgi:hypothetical protein
MKKLTFLTLAAALAFAAAPAFADQPTTVPKATNSQGSEVGQASSAFIHNGPTVSDQALVGPGNRSDLVHQCMAGLVGC